MMNFKDPRHGLLGFDRIKLLDNPANAQQILNAINHQQTAGALISAHIAVLADQRHDNLAHLRRTVVP